MEIKDAEVEENGWILYKYELWLYMGPLVTIGNVREVHCLNNRYIGWFQTWPNLLATQLLLKYNQPHNSSQTLFSRSTSSLVYAFFLRVV